MQRQFLQLHTLLLQRLQHAGREVQAGCGGCYRTLDFGINRLIGFLVAFFACRGLSKVEWVALQIPPECLKSKYPDCSQLKSTW